MEAIFHEQQEGSLCAQHCLNSLLQGQFYSAVDLAELARELDGLEMAEMAREGDSQEYRRFLQEPSVNMDDSGFFSVQVIDKALSVWGLSLKAFTSSDPVAVRARASPIALNAYICNYREHWFTIRRLGRQWFNLNSLLEGPELVSNTYLGEFLAQLQQEGYSIFIVEGQLPECDADLVLQAVTAEQTDRPRLLSERDKASSGAQGRPSEPTATSASSFMASNSTRDEEADIEAAMMLSLAENAPGPSGGPATIDNEELQRALGRGMGGDSEEQRELEMAIQLSNSAIQNQTSEEDELQQAISMSLSAGQPSPGFVSQPLPGAGVERGWGSRLEQQEAAEEELYKQEEMKQKQQEDDELQKALAMSMEDSPKKSNPAPAPTTKSLPGPAKPSAPAAQTINQQPTSIKNQSLGAKQKASPIQSSKPSSSSQVPASPAAVALPAAAAATPVAAGGTAMPDSGGQALGGRRARQPAETDPAEIRRRRLAFLEKMQQQK